MNKIIENDKLKELLPHGSGIDCEWEIETYKNGNVKAHNWFHKMDENGFYQGFVKFSVKIFRYKKDRFNKLKGPSKGKIQVVYRKGDIDFDVYISDKNLKYYLEDTMICNLKDVLTNRMEVINS